MINTTPYVRADGSVSAVPLSFHNPGTGVDEHGYIVLQPRDITIVNALVQDGFIERWASESGQRQDGRGSAATLTDDVLLTRVLTDHVLPAAQAEALRTGYSDFSQTDVLIDPDTVAMVANTPRALDPRRVASV